MNTYLGVRESQCLHLIAEGLSNKEIAKVMVISELTAKSHVHKILRKLGATNRAHCVSLGFRRGWLDLDRVGEGAHSSEPATVAWSA